MRLAAALLAAAMLALPAAPPAAARTAPESFADLAAQLLPAVVNIQTAQTATARGPDRGGPEAPQFPPGSPFEEFFRDFLERHPPGPQGPRQGQPRRRQQSLGSGFIIDPSGIVVTNNHVIGDADEISVVLHDNTTLKATLLGRDQRTDLAVLKIEAARPLPAVKWGSSDALRVGDWVLAIGNPFGLGGSVTAGIVSARGRNINQGPYDDFIQTDAAINRGNSGGPLFSMAGEVVGINTAIYSPSGGSIGIGFSIPAALAQSVVAQLREFGRTRRGWLGVRIQQVTDELAESVGLKEARGAMIAGIAEGGPADKAQLRNGDIVLRFNDTEVKELRGLQRVVADTPIGREVPVVVWRDGREVALKVTVGELPDDQQQAAATPGPQNQGARITDVPALGLKIAPLVNELRERFQLGDDKKGVVITEIAPGSAAADRGLRPGDLILEVQQEQVSTPADVTERVERIRKQGRRSVLMLIEGQGGQRWVPLPLAEPGPQRAPG